MRIACVSLSPLDKDGRVQRAVTALTEAAHDVLVIASAPLPRGALPYKCHALADRGSPFRQRLELVLTQAPATVFGAPARPLYWLPAARRDALRALDQFAPDLVICNDWDTLPIGAALKRRRGVRFIYDSHEFATQQHPQNWKWRWVAQRHVQLIERSFIGDADLVLTVSDGIAAKLQAIYALADLPRVIRNVPGFQPAAFRPAAEPLVVVFHGLIRHERGLEEVIDSMPAWRFAGRFVIRGYGLASYVESLRQRAAERGMADRVSFEPSLPPDQIVAAAASADIGCALFPGTADQYELALPNKLFEYLMAGLAVLATPRQEIAAILKQAGAGIIVGLDPQDIAARLNALTADEISRMKANAVKAATQLNWDCEKTKLLAAVDDAQRTASARNVRTEGKTSQ